MQATRRPRPAPWQASHQRYRAGWLREARTKKGHVFMGERLQVDKPEGAPAWLPDKIWKPQVKKVGTEKLEEL
jgi:hypothetical protein